MAGARLASLGFKESSLKEALLLNLWRWYLRSDWLRKVLPQWLQWSEGWVYLMWLSSVRRCLKTFLQILHTSWVLWVLVLKSLEASVFLGGGSEKLWCTKDFSGISIPVCNSVRVASLLSESEDSSSPMEGAEGILRRWGSALLWNIFLTAVTREDTNFWRNSSLAIVLFSMPFHRCLSGKEGEHHGWQVLFGSTTSRNIHRWGWECPHWLCSPLSLDTSWSPSMTRSSITKASQV